MSFGGERWKKSAKKKNLEENENNLTGEHRGRLRTVDKGAGECAREKFTMVKRSTQKKVAAAGLLGKKSQSRGSSN